MITNSMIEQLEFHSRERKTIRRMLCAYLRENKDLLKNDDWIRHKIGGGYLGDLTDASLIRYVKQAKEKRKDDAG